jgi:CRISPR/Cas system-associated endonuclease/helicase Cas3
MTMEQNYGVLRSIHLVTENNLRSYTYQAKDKEDNFRTCHDNLQRCERALERLQHSSSEAQRHAANNLNREMQKGDDNMMVMLKPTPIPKFSP